MRIANPVRLRLVCLIAQLGVETLLAQAAFIAVTRDWNHP